MQKLEWRESFELGIPEIDGDHRVMLELMRAVEATAAAQDRRRSERCVDRFLVFTELHFAREETLLERWGYPDWQEHARYHAGLVDRAKEVRKVCVTVETANDYQRCCEKMMSFLMDDIVRGDMKLKSYLENAGLGPQS